MGSGHCIALAEIRKTFDDHLSQAYGWGWLVVTANMAEGVLTIDLKRELPEALKPRRIEVVAPPIKLQALDDAAA